MNKLIFDIQRFSYKINGVSSEGRESDMSVNLKLNTGATDDIIFLKWYYSGALDAGEGNNSIDIYTAMFDKIYTGSGNDIIRTKAMYQCEVVTGAGQDDIYHSRRKSM